MRRYDCNLKEWERTPAYHLIPAGQWLKELLEAECSLEFLDKHCTWFIAKDATFKSAYVLANFIAQGKYPDGSVYNHYWTLQNIGYCECPRWRLATRDSRERWLSLMLPEDRPLQPMLERCFSLHKWLIDQETLVQIVEATWN